MSIRNLDLMFKPGSVAVIGAGCTPAGLGGVIVRNLLASGFTGDVFLVDPLAASGRAGMEGVTSCARVADLPKAPDLAVMAGPPDTLPQRVAELGARGTKAAAIVTAAPEPPLAAESAKLREALLEAAKPYLLRLLGPNCLGVLAPGANLNASLSPLQPLNGNIAFVSQSGAVLTSVLDWASARNIGFSHCISLGDMADVDFGDLLDYLANDSQIRAILLHMETITQPRKFISAARTAARTKPVLVVKAGRYPESAKAAAAHTGALAGRDEVFDAVFRRVGMLRVHSLQELFSAAKTLGFARSVLGDRLAILTNGGGMGVLAADVLIESGGQLARLSSETLERLNALLPPGWSRGNPVDLLSGAQEDRYAAALEVVLEDDGLDGALVLHCPDAITSPTQTARAVVEGFKKSSPRARSRCVLTCWPGESSVSEARGIFAESGLPTFRTPDDAVRGFMQMVRYKRNQELLMQTPPNIPEVFSPDTEAARKQVACALAEGRSWLTGAEAMAVLAAYAIPVVPTLTAATPEEAAALAAGLFEPVALKILSPDISCKSELCGVALGLKSPEAVRHAASAMLECVRESRSDARILGLTVQPMVERWQGRELHIGMIPDDLFGPVLFFGQGGPGAEAMRDTSFALPPLNMHLARELMACTRVHCLLEGCPGLAAADLDSIALTLVKLSQLVCDLPEIAAIDIDPLLADAGGVLVLDARIGVAQAKAPGVSRLAICPYPKELEETILLPDGQKLLIRPVRPEDEPAFHKVFTVLSPEEIRLRFLHPMRALTHSLAARLTQIDYDREMALVLASKVASGETELHGGVRISADPDMERAEFAILLRQEMTGLGLGPMLLRRIIEYARSRGIREIYGDVLSENRPMLKLCRAFGFTTRRDPEDPGVVSVTLKLEKGEGLV